MKHYSVNRLVWALSDWMENKTQRRTVWRGGIISTWCKVIHLQINICCLKTGIRYLFKQIVTNVKLSFMRVLILKLSFINFQFISNISLISIVISVYQSENYRHLLFWHFLIQYSLSNSIKKCDTLFPRLYMRNYL